jgi:hypothetical protein
MEWGQKAGVKYHPQTVSGTKYQTGEFILQEVI